MKVLPSRILILVLFVLVSCIGSGVVAEDIYVNNACSTAGNGRGTTCATSQGGVGPYTDLQVALNDNSLDPGDTIQIMAGTGRYVNTTDLPGVESAGFRIPGGTNGTANAWITIRGYQSERPVISSFQAGEFESSYSCSGTGNANGTCTSDSECAGVCIGNNTALSFDDNTGYIKLLGFDIEGGVYSLGGGTVGARPPLEVDDMDIMYGWGAWTGGGNWAGFYVREMRDLYIHNSRIHDIYAHGDNLTNAAVNIFYVSNAMIENNTFGPVHGDGFAGNKNIGVSDKICNPNLTVRHNHMVDINMGVILGAAQNACSDSTGPIANGGGRWYGNLIECRQQNQYGGTMLIGGPHTDGKIYNNTFDECQFGGYFPNDAGPVTVQVYNNIWSRTVNNNFLYRPPQGLGYDDDLWDYNVYTPGIAYGPDATLTARQGTRNVDLNSTEQPCSFIDLANGNYHLTPGSACTTFGHVGGVASGATVELGAFGAGDCIGDSCSGGGGGTTDPVGNVEGVPNRTDTK